MSIVVNGFNPHLFPGLLDSIFAVTWIVGAMNTMNCFDCADGVLGGTAGLALGYYGFLLVIGNQLSLALLSVSFAGACFGFLIFNFPPAKIFLGDAGSTALGALLGALSLVAAANPLHAPLGWVAALPIILPTADIVLVHARRYQNGTRNIRDLLASTGKDHLPHRMQNMGLSPSTTAIFLYIMTAGLCSAAALAGIAAHGSFMLLFMSLVAFGVTEWKVVLLSRQKCYQTDCLSTEKIETTVKKTGAKSVVFEEQGK
ncbi:MAG: undecaprenyl/decaprenyl-phosphate alpha-N-acetylglucosaminyl 1-phosphate transferase [Armatimonadetes bacterium]|nr:undecaprenyl/decaprenyl-phosphate alpha-N-acetylglucosaminyl 1-phosphate transferase [Armatimonadota bacterium]